MTKNAIIKAMAKVYWFVAIAGSFTHVQHACVKLGAEGWEMWAAPAMVDSMFLIAMLLRSEDWAPRTQRIGFWLMFAMGSISLAGNLYAANSAFGYAFGGFLPGAMLLGEWLADQKQLVTAKEHEAQLAIVEAERIAQAEADAIAAKKAASVAKGKATRAANARKNKAQVKALESLVNG